MLWIHLSKDIIPSMKKSNKSMRSIRPFKIVKKVNDDVYKVELHKITMSLLPTMCSIRFLITMRVKSFQA